MAQVSALEFQRNFKTYQDMAQHEPVEIICHGQPTLALMSAQEYKSVQMVNKMAFMTTEAENEILESIQNAEMDQRHKWLDKAADAQELYDAAFAVLPYLKASTDPYGRETIEEFVKDRELSAGDRLRGEADAADRKDAAILRLREALVEFAASETAASKP